MASIWRRSKSVTLIACQRSAARMMAHEEHRSGFAQRFVYGLYGESATLAGHAFRYAGRRADAESGLYYYRARYYSPQLGRFLQPDPIGYDGGINLYAYVNNDPLNNTDPFGTCGPMCVGAVVGVTVELLVQVVVEGKAITEVDLARVGISAIAGAAGGGLAKSFAQFATVGRRIAANTLGGATIGVHTEAAGIVADTMRGRPVDVEATDFVFAALGGAVGGTVGSAFGEVTATTITRTASPVLGETAGASVGEVAGRAVSDFLDPLDDQAFYTVSPTAPRFNRSGGK